MNTKIYRQKIVFHDTNFCIKKSWYHCISQNSDSLLGYNIWDKKTNKLIYIGSKQETLENVKQWLEQYKQRTNTL